MKKYYKYLILGVMALIVTSCAGLQPKRFVDDTNRFYSNYPQATIDIDKEFKYGGEVSYNYTLSSPDFAGRVNVTVHPFGVANKDNIVEKMVLIIFNKMDDPDHRFISTGIPKRNERMVGTMKFRVTTGFYNRRSLDRQQFNKAGYGLSKMYVGFIAIQQINQQEIMKIFYLEKYDYIKRDGYLLKYPEKWTTRQKEAINSAYTRGMKAITIH